MLSNCGAGGDCWRVPWTARRSNQLILKEINLEYLLERLLLSWMELFMAWSGHESFIKWDPGDSEERQKWYLPESQLDHKEGRVQKNWCFQTMVWEKTLQSPLDSKEIKPGNPKGNQPWILIGKTDAEAPILWLPDANSWLTGKDPDAGKDWRQRRKGWQRMRWLDGITYAMDTNLGRLWEIVRDREAWCALIHGVTKRWAWLSNWK